MVSTLRAPNATIAPPAAANKSQDSDLDDYEPTDNAESQQNTNFQPPLSNRDVTIADSLNPAANDAMHEHPIFSAGTFTQTPRRRG